MGMNNLDNFSLKSYERSALYKEKMKKYHDQKIKKCKFVVWVSVAFIQHKALIVS